MAKTPRFTDSLRYKRPYADSKASAEPGYLASRFKEIAEAQAKDEAERAEKLRPMKRAASK